MHVPFDGGAQALNAVLSNRVDFHFQALLSGASQDSPVIVGWSTAPRGQVIEKSLGQLPKPPECHYFCHY